MQFNGKASYLLAIITKWEDEKDSLPKDSYNRPKTVSKKAWINRNDPRELIINDFEYGRYYFNRQEFRDLSLICPTGIYSYDMLYTGESIVNQWFHVACKELLAAEKKYFESRDEKHIKFKQVKELVNQYGSLNNSDLNDIQWNGKKVNDVSEKHLDLYLAHLLKVKQRSQIKFGNVI